MRWWKKAYQHLLLRDEGKTGRGHPLRLNSLMNCAITSKPVLSHQLIQWPQNFRQRELSKIWSHADLTRISQMNWKIKYKPSGGTPESGMFRPKAFPFLYRDGVQTDNNHCQKFEWNDNGWFVFFRKRHHNDEIILADCDFNSLTDSAPLAPSDNEINCHNENSFNRIFSLILVLFFKYAMSERWGKKCALFCIWFISQNNTCVHVFALLRWLSEWG